MKFKKLTAAAMAAAMLAASAPLASVLNNALSITANAEEAAPDLQPGDIFGASRGTDGEWYYDWENENEYAYDFDFVCTVLDDNTISVRTYCAANMHIMSGSDIVIPSVIGGYTVTEIAPYCLGDYHSITIPKTVKTINHGAFANWFCCEEVIFEEGSQLELIDHWAFQNCRSLKSITIPASVETIGYGTFLNTEDQKLSWDNNDYTNTYSLKEVKFAEGSKLKTLGEWAFQDQKALKSVELPEGITTIEKGTFRYCTALQSITIPASVETIGDGDCVFYGCTALESVNFANNSHLKTINKLAFADMPALKSIDLPASVETIGNYAFVPTPSCPDSVLTAINVATDNPNFKSIDGVLYTKNGKTLVAYPAAKTGEFIIPDGVMAIQQGAFQLAQITSLTIPEGVTELSEDAVCLCPDLSSVTLPKSLTKIGKWAFQGPNKLTSIYIPENVTEIDPQAFEDSSLKNVQGVAGSYAETFAKENGYSFNSEATATDNTFTDDSEDKAADIQVTAKPDVIPKKAQFSVRLDDKNTTAERIAYNCYFTYNGAEYEPSDVVTVKIPVPVAMRDIADTLKVYHLQDGKYVNMSATVVDGYLVFETDHFSTYIVTAENLDNESDSGTVTPGDTDSANGSGDGSAGGSASGSDQQPTGIALALAPVVLAASAAVVVLSKKKK